MTFRYETWDAKIKRLSKWHKWFAWHPVFYNGTFIWLQSVWRRKEYLSPEDLFNLRLPFNPSGAWVISIDKGERMP